jgi:hypothetical protein
MKHILAAAAQIPVSPKIDRVEGSATPMGSAAQIPLSSGIRDSQQTG